ncbi:hypothetical protein [Chroococcidiopsis thermalis]|uniref:Uncharacterized protein n=1 Tax=Chroococcidiopsis thermalis (strain PCC 7203) TaxID=251229 RepID=K9UAC6_CHRTP|nr:hypothetical protein [Chroococcidiopsis thermalis]AFY91189.1 hypothetical protein Chro_5851 [Chroococcidiopsis thermalis PCC 7203]
MKTHYEFESERNESSYTQASNYLLRSQRSKRTWREKSSIAALMAVASGLMIVDISLHNLVLSSLMFLTSIVLMLPKEANALLLNFEKLQRKYGINIYTILFFVVSTIFIIDFASAPASAQFMNNAETFFRNTTYFPGINAQVVGFIFAILRGLFLIYLGIALVRIVQAARNDEDWQILARTPIIVAVTVVIGDILAGLIVGGAGGGAA